MMNKHINHGLIKYFARENILHYFNTVQTSEKFGSIFLTIFVWTEITSPNLTTECASQYIQFIDPFLIVFATDNITIFGRQHITQHTLTAADTPQTTV